MNDINACFISYRHTNDAQAHTFVQAFVVQLKKQLSWLLPGIPVFFDEDGLKVGDQFNNELALQLCQSACMVMFFSPLHFDMHHPYCALEYQAMLRLEKQRLGKAIDDLRNKGLILPVVFRGLSYLPTEISNARQYENFDHIVVASDFARRHCQIQIKKIANQIFLRYKVQSDAGVFNDINCRHFNFPDKVEIEECLIEVSQLRSFRMPGH